MKNVNAISGEIVSAAFRVHSALGPGLLESTYEACLTHELVGRGLRVERQLALPVVYDGVKLEVGYRIDLFVERVVVGIEAVAELAPVHVAQVLSYLKLSGARVGLLINFNVLHLRTGIRRLVNNL